MLALLRAEFTRLGVGGGPLRAARLMEIRHGQCHFVVKRPRSEALESFPSVPSRGMPGVRPANVHFAFPPARVLRATPDAGGGGAVGAMPVASSWCAGHACGWGGPPSGNARGDARRLFRFVREGCCGHSCFRPLSGRASVTSELAHMVRRDAEVLLTAPACGREWLVRGMEELHRTAVVWDADGLWHAPCFPSTSESPAGAAERRLAVHCAVQALARAWPREVVALGYAAWWLRHGLEVGTRAVCGGSCALGPLDETVTTESFSTLVDVLNEATARDWGHEVRCDDGRRGGGWTGGRALHGGICRCAPATPLCVSVPLTYHIVATIHAVYARPSEALRGVLDTHTRLWCLLFYALCRLGNALPLSELLQSPFRLSYGPTSVALSLLSMTMTLSSLVAVRLGGLRLEMKTDLSRYGGRLRRFRAAMTQPMRGGSQILRPLKTSSEFDLEYGRLVALLVLAQ